ncbi:MAG: glycosyltransferase [Desulfobacteraceae bacterium]|nr:glycosyltransferase [Desulfobacteraceae bacterium]MBC2752733.1 glycosyltransferase [Desulfobacteraceae bacterium]
MKISIITAGYNCANTILDTIESIKEQSYDNIEHIIVDGNSNDNTINIIKQNAQRIYKIISEPDNGIYDAFNKGIYASTGDIVGFLNSDDIFAHRNVVKKIANTFKNTNIDAVYGDVIVFRPNQHNKIFRYSDSSKFTSKLLARGCMPAHPTMYCKKEVYQRIGNYKTTYKIASDFEFVIRLFNDLSLKTIYINEVLVKMRKGGVSSKNIFSNFTINKEIYRACKENRVATNYIKIYSKYFLKIFELINIRSLNN